MTAAYAVDLSRYKPLVHEAARPIREGVLVHVLGLILEVSGLEASIGDVCSVARGDANPVEAEVVGLRNGHTLLMPLATTDGLKIGAAVRHVRKSAEVAVGDGLLGRVLDGLGRPMDGRPLPILEDRAPLRGNYVSPLGRRPIDEPFEVGVRAIDGLLTMGKGQRIGIFAGGGVGKSSLLGMMVRRAKADVAVIALVGERGREVEEFVNRTLGDEGLAKSVVVAATSAAPPLVRVRAALLATTVAESFRAQGKTVLLVMDSVTRFAMALREIGLATGEPPATKGYPPTVFAALPRLLERAGTSEGEGSITGVYTVLVEGDDLSDPVADAARAILDGHIVLNRALAERGYFPAIDVAKSVSRIMPHVVNREHMQLAIGARELLSSYGEVEDLVTIGAYQQGAVPRFDEALHRMPRLERFLRQELDDSDGEASVIAALGQVWIDEA